MAAFNLLPNFCVLALSLAAIVYSFDGFDMVFKTGPINTPHALLVKQSSKPFAPTFSQFPDSAWTISFYVLIEQKSEDDTTLISYSSKETQNYNEVYLEVSYKSKQTYTAFVIDAERIIYKTVPPLGTWVHICVSWRKDTGRVHMYIGGVEVEGDKKEIKAGYSIGTDGFLVIGNDQDYYNSYFEVRQGLVGKMTQFNMWDKELILDEVNVVRNCNVTGGAVDWSSSEWELYDGVTLQATTVQCYRFCNQMEKNMCNCRALRRAATLAAQSCPAPAPAGPAPTTAAPNVPASTVSVVLD